MEPLQVNGKPGAVRRERTGNDINAWALDLHGGRIQTIRTAGNSEQLAHVGPVADGWANLRENTRRTPSLGMTAERTRTESLATRKDK